MSHLLIKVTVRGDILTTDIEWIVADLIRRPLRRWIEERVPSEKGKIPRRDFLTVEKMEGEKAFTIWLGFQEKWTYMLGEDLLPVVKAIKTMFSLQGDSLAKIVGERRRNLKEILIEVLLDGKMVTKIEIQGNEISVDGKRIYPLAYQKRLDEVLPQS
jgi:hypothetical protein